MPNIVQDDYVNFVLGFATTFVGDDFFQKDAFATRRILVDLRAHEQVLQNSQATPQQIEAAKAGKHAIEEELKKTPATPLMQAFVDMLKLPQRTLALAIAAEKLKAFTQGNIENDLITKRKQNDELSRVHQGTSSATEEEIMHNLKALSRTVDGKKVGLSFWWAFGSVFLCGRSRIWQVQDLRITIHTGRIAGGQFFSSIRCRSSFSGVNS